MRNSPASAYTLRSGCTENSTSRAGSPACNSAAMALTSSEMLNQAGRTSALLMRESRSKSSISCDMRCEAWRILSK